MANKEFLENYRAEILGYDLIENIYLNEEELLQTDADDVFYDDEDMPYKKVKVELTNEELNQYIMLEILNKNQEMAEKINTIRNVVLFWFVLTVIIIICCLYILSQM